MNIPPFEAPQIEELQDLLPAYEILDFIAQGGMGAVYRARQISLDREVAIKILPLEFGEDPEFRTAFETEAKAMARLNHPNLIGVYDFGDVRGMPFIVMEYINGRSLYHSAWNTVVEATQAVQIVKGICEGLAHAHVHGIIHRDIKPANILLTPNAEPKIGDFGLALASGQNGAGLVMGTPGYAAPELFHPGHAADEQADIFAVGVLLHELLTGQPPDSSGSAACNSTGDTGLDVIWRKAVHPDPHLRFKDVSAMVVSLNAWMRDHAQPTPRHLMAQPALRRRTKPVRQHSATARSKPSLAGRFLLIVGILGAVAFAYQNHQKGQGGREIGFQRQEAPSAPSPLPADVGDIDAEGDSGGALTPLTNESSPERIQPEKVDESPEDIATVLGRTKDSLGDAKPVFPPGTFMIADRHFAPILGPVDRAEAERLAELAGGVIAVPATTEEADAIDECCRSLTAPDGLWLGGQQAFSLWRWDSGENWSFARWSSGTHHDLVDSALVIIPGAGWKNADPTLKASGVLIEWSSDPTMKIVAQEADSIAILNEFDATAKDSLGVKITNHEKRLARNSGSFTVILNRGLQGIVNSKDRQQWAPQVDALKKLANKNNRVPDAFEFRRRGIIDLTPNMEKACKDHFLKQQEYEVKFTSEMTVIRDYYVKYLKKSADDLYSKGQIAMANRITTKVEAAADLDAWLTSLKVDGGGVMTPEPEAVELAIAGPWSWQGQASVITFRLDQTVVTPKKKQLAIWKVMPDQTVVVRWGNGKWIDTLHLSADGQRLTGTNQHSNHVSAVRAREQNQDVTIHR